MLLQWDAVIFGAHGTGWHHMQKRGGARGKFSFNNSFNDQTKFELVSLQIDSKLLLEYTYILDLRSGEWVILQLFTT